MKHNPSSTSTPRKQHLFSSSYLITILFIIFVLFIFSEDLTCMFTNPFTIGDDQQQEEALLTQQQYQSQPQEKDHGVPFVVEKREKECNIFEGEWLYDETRPLYAEKDCPYIQPQLTCQAHGRPDSGYQHWRWQPHACSLPRFNATLMLDMLRGKRLMFVGDSLNRGQFISLVCLLHHAIPENAKSMETFDSLTVFKAKDYNATIEFYWAPFLVESNSDDALVHRVADRIVRVGSINKHARHWKGADILVFNTYLWWMAGLRIKTIRGPFKNSTDNITLMPVADAYKLALRRMLKWANKNMDLKKTRMFFVSMSPSHYRSEDWGGEPNGNCYNEKNPIKDPKYWGSGTDKTVMSATGEVFSTTNVPITMINITQLSEYRPDAHTQIYKKQWTPLTAEQIANPRTYSDCIHWCLPGLQDTWNELLYTQLFFPH